MRTKNGFLNSTTITLATARQSAEILRALAKYGMNEAQIKQIETLLNTVQQLDDHYHDVAAEAKIATQTLKNVRTQTQKIYVEHVVLSRIALKEQPELQEKMELNGMRQKRLADWLSQVNNFYRHAEAQKETLAQFNVSAENLSEVQKLLTRIKELQTLQRDLKGRMQVISQQRKGAFTTLQRSMTKFFRIARIALEEEPQHLERLGLAVKATV